MMKTLTIKQKMVYEAIEMFIKENGYSPTLREIAKMINIDVHSAFDRVLILERKGYISTKNGKQRTIRLLRGLDDD